jgi:hypothetical protein
MSRIALLFVTLPFAWAAPPATPTVSFQRDIRPILSDNCFSCHGPDSKSRMAGLRLDLKASALEARKSGAPIVPGKPADSLAFQRIIETNAAKKMPPEYSHKKLTPAQVATFKNWIEQGAPWKEHWAYQAPVRPTAPVVRNTTWARTPIDRFILAKLEAQGLTPAPAANRRTLIRRVALDLTGLPPQPEEVEQFLADKSPNAYEKMIDRYLASPQYGEHRAHYWLDAARYGDTHGIHVDNYREMWPYRDWVIQAYNRNLTFDQFTIEQLAGDLLPNPTLEQRVATGFHRNNVTTNEAGLIEDEYAEIYAKDRADTTGAVWLGMTVGCATCHDHKFDPIPQKDFYALGAYFRNTTQRVMDDNIPDTPPIVLVPALEDRERWPQVSARLGELRTSIAKARQQEPAAFAQWLSSARPADARPLDAASEWFTANLAKLADGAKQAKMAESNIAGRTALTFIENEGLPVPNSPKLDADKPFTIAIDFLFPKAEQGYTLASQQVTVKDPVLGDKTQGWVINVGGRVVGMNIWGDNGQNIEIRAAHLEQIKHGTWNHLVVTYDGSRHQSGLGMFLNGRAINTQGRGNQNVVLKGAIAIDQPLLLGRSLKDGAIADFRVVNRVVNESEAYLLSRWTAIEAALGRQAASAEDREALLVYYLSKQDPAFGKLAGELTTLNLEARAITRRGAITHVMNERMDQMPSANILFRGAYDQKRAKVEASTPTVLPPMPADLPNNRLGFAKWLMRPENPMTARVTANRMWQEVFGTGIVKTTDDFGSQGEPPTHQELLDWLAVDFRENGWDMKRFYKQLLLSATYQQSAVATPAKLAKDPENRLLSRGPRFRMDAEMIRDYALASGGLLNLKVGGPSVKPYQPEGVWEAVAMVGSNTRFYQRDGGDKLYRRSLYTFIKRSAPPASLDIFNAPSREACTVRRERTNTPLQALVTMNDTQFMEAARNLAQRAYVAAPVLDGRLDFITANLLARPLEGPERQVAMKAYREYAAYYDTHPKDAMKLLQVGEKPAERAPDMIVSAALTMLAHQLLNLDEVLTK